MQILQSIKSIAKTLVYVLFTVLVQFGQALGVLCIAIINNRPWECLFIFVGFAVGRKFFGNTYHAPSLWLCTIITWTAFYFLTSAVPSFGLSITLPCVFGVCLAYVLSIIGEYLEGRKNDAT